MKPLLPAILTGVLLSSSALVAPSATYGQTPIAELPGYFPLEHLELLAPDEITVEVNLRGAMLKMISVFTGDEDPDFAELVGGLDAVHVRSGELSAERLEAVRGRIAAGKRWLEEHHWLAMVQVRDGDEWVYIYTREDGSDMVGLAILAIDDTEATAINLIGRIDPAKIGRIAEGFDLGGLDDIQERIDEEQR